MRRPVNQPYTITTGFGVPDSNAYFGKHSGVDYAVPAGRQVLAPASGRIWWAGSSPTGGNMIILFDGQFYHRLMHNSVLRVTPGRLVSEGQHIADSGSTGLSTGPHVHWDIASEMLPALRPSSFDKFIDPAKWLAGEYSNNAQGDAMEAKVNTDDEAAELVRSVFKREPVKEEIESMKGRYWKERLVYLRTSKAGQEVAAKVADYDKLASENQSLKKRLAEIEGQAPQASTDLVPAVNALLDKLNTIFK
jgi:hypothetical protein